MYVAQQKRHENIAEYLLYMWQVEDILRALAFDPDKIHRYVLSGYSGTEEEKSRVEQWYIDLARQMTEEGVREQGHLSFLKGLVAQLETLTEEMLKSKTQTLFATLYYAALPAIVQLRDKGGSEEHGEVETALIGIYGYIQLREQGKEVSDATLKGMKQLSTFLAMVADRFRVLEEGGDPTLEQPAVQ